MPCAACQEGFVWAAGEQAFFASKGFTNPPKSCRGNRQARKNQREMGSNGVRQGASPDSCPYGEGAHGRQGSAGNTFRPAPRRQASTITVEPGVSTSGQILKVLQDRSFGFIQDDGGVEYYFHQDGVDDDFYALTEGTRVSFVTDSSPRGPRAVQVARDF